MAHNTRTRADLTAWSTGAVSPTEFDDLDTKGFKSINGDDGGVWAPADVVELGGAGLLMSGPFETTGDATMAAVTIEDLLVGANAQFNGDVTLGNTSADTISFEGVAEFTQDATFDGNALFNDPVSFFQLTDFFDTATFHDVVDFLTDVTFAGEATFEDEVNLDGAAVNLASGAELNFGATARIVGTPVLGVRMRFDDDGRVPWRQAINSGNASYGVETNFIFCNGTSDRAITLDATGADDGDRWLVAKESSSSAVTIALPGSGSLILPAGDSWLCLIASESVNGSGPWNAFAWKADIFDNGV